MKKTIPLILFLATAVTSLAKEPSQAWTMFGRDLQNTNHYPFETASTYKQAWEVRIGCPAPGMSSTIVDERGMYNTSPCSNTGDTHAVGHDGKELWSHGVGQGNGGVVATPCIHGDTLYTIDNGWIKALGVKDGIIQWKEEVICGKTGLASPIVYERNLYLSGPKGVQILSIDRTKSAEDSLLEIEGGHGSSTPAFYKGAMIVLSSKNLHSFDTKTLKQNWKAEVITSPTETLVNSPIIDVKNGRVFVTSTIRYKTIGHLFCLNFADGSNVWEQETGGIFTIPAITFDGSKLYLASVSGTVTAYDSETGKKEWVWTSPGEAKPKENGKMDHNRALRGIISTKNKLLFSNRHKLFIISNDKPEGIDFEIELNGFNTPTPAFYNKDLYVRFRPKNNRACNYRYTEVTDKAGSDLEVSIIKGKALIHNLTDTKLSFLQFCYGINENEKQNCVPFDLILQPGEKTELDLEQFLPVDESVHHLLLCMEYESSKGKGEFHHYFEMSPSASTR